MSILALYTTSHSEYLITAAACYLSQKLHERGSKRFAQFVMQPFTMYVRLPQEIQ